MKAVNCTHVSEIKGTEKHLLKNHRKRKNKVRKTAVIGGCQGVFDRRKGCNGRTRVAK
jgi:hypothetical protein